MQDDGNVYPGRRTYGWAEQKATFCSYWDAFPYWDASNNGLQCQRCQPWRRIHERVTQGRQKVTAASISPQTDTQWKSRVTSVMASASRSARASRADPGSTESGSSGSMFCIVVTIVPRS